MHRIFMKGWPLLESLMRKSKVLVHLDKGKRYTVRLISPETML